MSSEGAMTPEQAVVEIANSIKRQKANVQVTRSPSDGSQPFMLQAGSFRMIVIGNKKSPDGFIVSMGMSADRLRQLRDQCDELLRSIQ